MGVEIDPDAHRALNRYLQNQHPDRSVVSVTATGWHSENLFIMPRRNIDTGDAIFQAEDARLDDFSQSGILEGWQQEIGTKCEGNPLLMLAVCCALAGPLLRPLT